MIAQMEALNQTEIARSGRGRLMLIRDGDGESWLRIDISGGELTRACLGSDHINDRQHLRFAPISNPQPDFWTELVPKGGRFRSSQAEEACVWFWKRFPPIQPPDPIAELEAESKDLEARIKFASSHQLHAIAEFAHPGHADELFDRLANSVWTLSRRLHDAKERLAELRDLKCLREAEAEREH